MTRTRRSSVVYRTSWITALATLLTLGVTAIAFGHAVVFPRNSTTGAYERYMLRVPNEKAVATTRVEMRFPAEVKVNSFSDVPGWQLEVKKDSAQRIVGAVWTGTLLPNRFVEFPFVAVNPKTTGDITWPATQTYADGEVVEWSGPKGSKSPASVTVIAAAADAGTSGASSAPSSNNMPFWLSIAALALSLISLGLAIRKPVT